MALVLAGKLLPENDRVTAREKCGYVLAHLPTIRVPHVTEKRMSAESQTQIRKTIPVLQIVPGLLALTRKVAQLVLMESRLAGRPDRAEIHGLCHFVVREAGAAYADLRLEKASRLQVENVQRDMPNARREDLSERRHEGVRSLAR